jgi:hypothetical protein
MAILNVQDNNSILGNNGCAWDFESQAAGFLSAKVIHLHPSETIALPVYPCLLSK